MGKRILITSPVHQTAPVFIEYLNSLSHLIIPEDYIIDKYFYLHNCSELASFLQPNEYEIIENDINLIVKDRHEWNDKNFNIVSIMRTKALEKARTEKYDYIFSVDSDVLLHPKTLCLLLQDNKDIVSTAYWYKLRGGIAENFFEYENWKKARPTIEYTQKGIYEIGITGAATLIGKRIIQDERINYYPIDCIDFSKWEDYAFCLKARVLIPDVQIAIDTRLPARHLYTEKDYKRWMMEKKQYE